jgi:hypothetical protein
MDQILLSPYEIPRNAHQRELAAIDPAMYLPIPVALRVNSETGSRVSVRRGSPRAVLV